MFIECRHCHTIYRIDEKKIPSQECFVRCSKCLNPMKLKIKKLVSSQTLNKNVIECPECKARYLVLSEKLSEKALNVRCGDCDHTFSLSDSIVGVNLDEESSLSLLNDLSFEEDSSSNGSEIAMESISLPDDLDENKDKEEDADAETTQDEAEKSDRYLKDDIHKTALEDYLEAVSLNSQEGEDQSETDIDPIPLEQKNKIFLRAYSKQTEVNESKNDDSSSKEQPLDKNAEPDAVPKEEPIPEKQSIAPVDKGGDKRTILLIFIALILGGLIVGGLLFFKTNPENAAFTSRETSTSKRSGLVILEPLKGRYEVNKNEGKIFVIEGKVANYHPEKIKVSYLQIEGSLYNKYNKGIGDSSVYAGNVMTKTELKKRTKIEIMAFLNNKRGKNSSNLNVRAKQSIPFQVVFFKAPDNIYKIGAKISNFLKQ